jgi:hypothetical protein
VDEKSARQRIFYEGEKNIFVPNEILNDLRSDESIKSGIHIAFCYSYYYLISYLYRYAKYGQQMIKQDEIKDILGYNPGKEVDYLIKKNGVLDKMEYTYTSTDFPVMCQSEYDERKNKVIDIKFTLHSEFKKDNPMSVDNISTRNYRIKIPAKGLHRDKESEEDGHLNGTFYEVENTHSIHPLIFIKAISNKGIGIVGFYLYGFFKKYSDMYPSGYNISYEDLMKSTRLKKTKLNDTLIELARYNFIDVDRADFILNAPKDKRESNCYRVNDIDKILDDPKKIRIREVVQYKDDNKDNIVTWEDEELFS